MNRDLIKNYVDEQKEKVVKTLDLSSLKIAYDGIIQGRKIQNITGDEEMCRAFLLTRLVNELGYSADKIEIEHEYTAGRPHTNTSRIDIVVRDNNGDAFLFIEVKCPEDYVKEQDKTIEEQLYKVSFMENAEGHKVKYLVLYTIAETDAEVSDECIIIDTESYPTFADWEIERNVTNDLPIKYGKAQHKPYIKDSDKDLEKNFTSEMLNQLQLDLHNVLWGGGGTDDNEVFASLTNLILAKIQDEDTTETGEVYKFQSLTFENDGDEEFETNEQLFERINALYRDALKAKLYILDEEELAKSYVIDSKKFSLSKLKYAVQKLEGLSFVDGKNSLSGKDILGDFFEGIIRNGFKQSKGQFFTHINIVRFMLWAIQADKLAISRIKNDKEIPYMIDPSAGSGTFLIEYMKFITENMKYRFREQLGSTRAVKDKIESDWFYPDNRENKWAQTYIYASESNFNLGTATKVNMILHGDGSTNIFVKDGLLPFSQYEKETAPNVLHDGSEEALYYGKEVNGNFDIILTNPPFSVDLDNDTKKSIQKSFVFGGKKNSENLFIERWYQLLRENGRVAAVLPESVFDTTENKYIRLFIYKFFKVKAVVSLPQVAFEPFTSTKTSILFAQKKTADEIRKWNEIWDEKAKEYARIKTRVENIVAVYDGKKEKKKLPSIKDLSENEEKNLLVSVLKFYISDEDKTLSNGEIIEKYRDEIKGMCTIDKDTADYFGYVNTWWVFGEVANVLNQEVFMAEVDNVGYKRTKRGEKEMPNDLFELEYAPEKLDVISIEAEYRNAIYNLEKLIKESADKIDSESNEKKKARLEKKQEEIKEFKKEIENESKNVKKFITKYYDSGQLKKEYKERTDEELVSYFKSGVLNKYSSGAVVLHENTYHTVLDYMRDIEWD
ncbi:restriction endonuclease subunit M [Butyribacter sp.]|uniref:restriction endonuclease subunit M n=1 Tax=Butyribacter sp. TaxID=2822465 RepID=UPI002A95DD91|nr:N-6 DNA methylase [Butyribacter sp.]